MPILLENLINQLPRDTEEKVSSARERLRQRIRDVLGEETRFFLQGKSRGRLRTVPINLQITVKPGLSDILKPVAPEDLRSAMRQIRRLAPGAEVQAFEACLQYEMNRLPTDEEGVGAGA